MASDPTAPALKVRLQKKALAHLKRMRSRLNLWERELTLDFADIAHRRNAVCARRAAALVEPPVKRAIVALTARSIAAAIDGGAGGAA